MTMNDDELLRYSRQIMLPDIDLEGQETLLASRVLVVGLGGLGCPVAMYLAAAGVGQLDLLDFDEVDLSNLQRQIAHTTDRIGQKKVVSAAETIRQLNPSTKINLHEDKLDDSALGQLIDQCDLVVDCTDNFEIRFTLNALCVNSVKPLVSGAAIRLEGQLMVVDPRSADNPCYQCLYQEADEMALNCVENGVAAPVVGAIGALQAMEAIKVLIGFGESLAGYLLVFDARYMDWRKLRLKKNPVCRVCSQRSD